MFIMFRYTVIAVGKLKNKALQNLCADFKKRIQRQGHLEIIELKDGTIESESKRILEALERRPEAKVYTLAEEGITQNSHKFAKQLLALQGRPAVFVIGGAFGLSAAVKKRADVCFSLSPMTFTHEMARYLLCEQLYRSVSINSGSKYHHD
jgi:23S rRNA (pseudouridine1915-N3)-methyltransferase